MELRIRDYADYNNQVEITIKTAATIDAESMKEIHSAIENVISNARKGYRLEEKEADKE